MTKANKVLFITQEIKPYLPSSEMAVVGRTLPQSIQESGKEIRTFMPKWGNINERRNQLHEVIRLSGMNIIIDDTDHPLIIKVASIQAARMQVYFIDNDDYFQHMASTDVGDAEEENDERAIFYSRSVLETVKKLRWSPDIVHCHGWVSALVPLYIKKSYNEEPSYRNSKIVYSLYGGALNNRFPASFRDKLIIKGVSADDVKCCGDETGVSINDLSKLAIDYSDGIILHGDNIAPEVMEYLDKSGKPYIKYEDTPEFIDKCNQLYEQVS